MGPGDILTIGILLVAVGAALWLVFRGLLNAAAGRAGHPQGPDLSAEKMAGNPGAWLIVESGGRLQQCSPQALELFRLDAKDTPDLERLARATRPNDEFLNRCVQEGVSRLDIQGQPVEITSFRLPAAGRISMLVSLRALGGDPGAAVAGQNIPKISELIQAFHRRLDIESTLLAIQECLEQVLPADWIEITLWEPEIEQLAAYRFAGSPGGERRIENNLARYPINAGYVALLLQDQEPHFVEDLARQPELRPAGGRGTEALRSLIGIVLKYENNLVGTLAAGSLMQAAFSKGDASTLAFIANSAANALNNVRRYRDEQHRAAELSSLSQLAQGFSTLRDPKSLFARLVQSILPLINVDILGFLIYNESTRTLEGQEPIFGMPPQFVELYRIPVLQNSIAEQMLVDQDLIITENAAESAEWEALGLSVLAQAASLRDTLLVPLTSGGRMLGYLQASNHTDGSLAFTQDEIHLMNIVANQAAPVIENANLIMQSRQRAQRAEALRRIASLASSAATLDEILKFALQELCHLLQADLGVLFLIDPNYGILQMHAASLFGSPPDLPGVSFSLFTDDPQFPFTITGSQRALTTRNINSEKAIVPFYQQIMQAWQVVSVVSAPLVVRNAGIGEIWLCSRQDGAFDQGDLQVAATAAGQLAGVVEQSSLSAQTDENLRRRVDQLTTLTRLSRELSLTRDLRHLLDMLYDELLRITGAACGSIALYELTSLPGSEPEIQYHSGERLTKPLSEAERSALLQGSAIYRDHLVRDGFEPPHAGVESALTVPVRIQNRLVGMIELHAAEPDGFSADEVEVVQSLAIQAAVALENSSLYQEQRQQESLLERKLDLMNRLYELGQAVRGSQSLPEAFAKIVAGVCTAAGFQKGILSLYEPDQAMLRLAASFGLEPSIWKEMQSRPQPWRDVEPVLAPEFQVGSVYFIPAGKTPDASNVSPSNVGPAAGLETAVCDGWRPEDRLLAPLLDPTGKPLGLISLDVPENGCRPGRAAFEAFGLLADQASRLIEERTRSAERDQRFVALETDLSRQKQAADQSRTQVPLFLRRDLEQTLAIQATQRQLDRVRAGLEMAEQANRQPDAIEALRTLAHEMLTRLDMQVALVGEMDGSGVHLLEVIGSTSTQSNPEALFGQRNPLSQLLQDSRMRLVADVDEDPEWRGNPLLSGLNGRSFIALPLTLGQTRQGGVLVIGQRVLPPFSEADTQIYAQLSRQVGLGTQNLGLLTETRRRLHEMDLLLQFSRKLGMLDPRGILSALVETALQVLSVGDAGWVGLWSEEEHALVPAVAHGYTDNEPMQEMRYRPNPDKTVELLPLRVYHSGQPMRGDVAFAQDYSLPQEELLAYRKATGGRLPVSTLVIPVGRGDHPLGVLVIDHFSLSNAFQEEDESLAMALAQQSTLALENARLFVSAEQRAAQLQALNQVSAALTSSLQPGELISSLLGLLQGILPFDTATLWLRTGDTLTIASASGFEDNERRLGISVSVQDSALFQEMVRTTQPLSVPDVRLDPRFTSLVEPDHLSWLGIPLLSKSELIGALALEKHEPGAYGPEHLQAAVTFASQSGVALENARLFEESTLRAAELDQRSQRLAVLNRLSSDLSASLDGDTILRLACQQLLEALSVDGVAVVLTDETGSLLLKAEEPGGFEALPRMLSTAPLIERLRESGGSFSIPEILGEKDLAPLDREYFIPRGANSVMVVPLVTAVTLHGWLFIQTYRVYHFTPSEIELARTMANQAAVAYQNARLYNETRRLTQDLERRVEERTGEVIRAHNNTQTLLRIITELSTSLDLDQVMTRTLFVLNETIGSEQSMIVLNEGKTYQAGMELVFVDPTLMPTYTSSGLVRGSIEREIVRWVIKKRAPALIENIAEDTRWKLTFDKAPNFASAVAVPLILGEEIMGTMLLLARKPSAFILEQVSLIEATARQFSISLNNATLFNLIRDQSMHLGNMLREQQIEASRSRAILEAVADGILVTDAAMQVTLYNASAERILNLKAGDVMDQSLDAFIGLFGNAGQVWHATIQRWSKEAGSLQPGETYGEQINLENGRVVAVNLAPVFFRNEFLATVSIFRDITQEVQVDRLKSEFVANVSHELRTPMTSIKGYVEIMLMGAAGEISPQQKQFLSTVKANTERLNVLVNDLLDVSKIEAGRITISVQPLNLAEITAEVLYDIQGRSRQENKPMDFRTDIPADLPVVMGDTVRVRQVLANLVNNSYLYTPANGQVLIRIRHVAHEVQIDVQDNGIGIDPKVQNRIFERFYRGEDPLVLASAGTGLGLAISKILVEMHRGRIWFCSSGVRGEGSLFSFTLPVRQDEE